MLFNSIEYLLFFPTVTALYYLLSQRYRWILIVLASCIFYMAFVPKYILILFFLILVDYIAGICIEGAQGWRRKAYLISSLIANVGVLAFFKYYSFAAENVSVALGWLGVHPHFPVLDFIFPIGLSFHTFQSMSYTIEVYYGRYPAERHLGYYALYVLFFPQLVAGPIERPQNLLPQLHQEHAFEYDRVVSGLRLMLVGLLKKVVIADRIGILVDQVYNNPAGYSGWPIWLATYLFGIQVYCDFSGYSDMARGAGRVLGIEMMENFRRPFLASDISEFWRRWHISLFSWFKEYIYLPIALGGNKSILRMCVGLLIVFGLSGLWHGAAWSFVIWGLLHGIYCVVAFLRTLRRKKKKGKPNVWQRAVGAFITFQLVSFSWLFFRCTNLPNSWHLVTHLFAPAKLAVPFGLRPIALSILLTLALFIYEIDEERFGQRPLLDRIDRPWVRWSLYYASILAIVFYGMHDGRQFIYFQF